MLDRVQGLAAVHVYSTRDVREFVQGWLLNHMALFCQNIMHWLVDPVPCPVYQFEYVIGVPFMGPSTQYHNPAVILSIAPIHGSPPAGRRATRLVLSAVELT